MRTAYNTAFQLRATACKSAGRCNRHPYDDKEKTTMNDTTKTTPKTQILTATACEYLILGMEKLAAGPHPNFLRAASPNSKAVALEIQRVVQATKSPNIRRWVISTLNILASEVRNYVQFLKDLCSNVAFTGYMEWRRLDPNKAVDAEHLRGGLDAMYEEHPWEGTDVPQHDLSDAATRNPPMEEREPSEDPIIFATDQEDAVEAVHAVQLWLGLAILRLNENQRNYWLADPEEPRIQVAQRKVVRPAVKHPESGTVLIHEEVEYLPIYDWDEYVSHQDTEWKKKRSTVASSVGDNVEQLMAAS